MIYILAQERVPADIERQISVLSNIVNYIWNDTSIHYIFAINSDLLKSAVKISKNVQLVPSLNDNWEFTAYDTAYAYLVKNYDVSENDIIIISNETIHREYNSSYNKLFFNKKIKKWVQKGYLVGLKGYLPRRLKIFNLYVNNYVATHLFIIKYGLLKKLIPFSLQCEDEYLFSSDDKKLFLDNAPIDSQIIRKILGRITIGRSDDESFIKHYKSMTLTPDNRPYIIGKAKAIIAEYYLGAKANRNGIKIKNLKKWKIIRLVIAYIIQFPIFKRIFMYMIKKKIINHTPRTGKWTRKHLFFSGLKRGEAHLKL